MCREIGFPAQCDQDAIYHRRSAPIPLEIRLSSFLCKRESKAGNSSAHIDNKTPDVTSDQEERNIWAEGKKWEGGDLWRKGSESSVSFEREHRR